MTEHLSNQWCVCQMDWGSTRNEPSNLVLQLVYHVMLGWQYKLLLLESQYHEMCPWKLVAFVSKHLGTRTFEPEVTVGVFEHGMSFIIPN